MKPAWLHAAGAVFVADPSGALVWPAQDLLVVADLHLEKGSSLARRGALVPPYDTRTTLTRLEEVLACWGPRRVISLGDSFHDAEASRHLGAEDRARLERLIAAHQWLWLAGNHDPTPTGLGGQVARAVEIAGITFRHLPEPGSAISEIAGHLHPSASLTVRGRRLTRRCFVADDRRLILPAFGSYAGGLDVFDPAIDSLFVDGFRATLLGDGRVHVVSRHRLQPQGAAPPRRIRRKPAGRAAAAAAGGAS